MSNNRLPGFDWQYKTTLYNNFNRQLIDGYNQGLGLYDRENYDIQHLYKDVNLKPIETYNMNFDELNKQMDIVQAEVQAKNDAMERGKNIVKGIVNQINDSTHDTGENIKNTVYNFFDHVVETVKDNAQKLLVIGLVFMVVYKKV